MRKYPGVSERKDGPQGGKGGGGGSEQDRNGNVSELAARWSKKWKGCWAG